MALPTFTMRQLLESGLHYGHAVRRRNPKMSPYIFGIRNGIHIIDLQQTVPLLYKAMEVARNVAAKGGRVLFVGTKHQVSEKIQESAKRCGQYYVNHRWLGGTLTNWKTVNQSIKRFKEMKEELVKASHLTKKEQLKLQREINKLDRAIGGIQEMGGLPDLLFVIDTNRESIAIKEAQKLNIPIVAVVDTNSDPDHIDYIIPGNDDAIRSINLYCDLMSSSILDGLQAEMRSAGVDLGELEIVPEISLPLEINNESDASNTASL